MTRPATEAAADILDRLEALVQERFGPEEAGLAARFVCLYYARVRREVLEARDLLDLYGAALAHLGLARRRRPKETSVRVYNPSLEEDGWECPHTVVQILIEDMPFLVDSVRMALNRCGLAVLRIIHPVLAMRRDASGRLLEVLDRGAGGSAESVMHLEAVRQTDPALIGRVEAELLAVLDEVRSAVADWQPMRDALMGAVAELERDPPPLPADDLAEVLAFLRWLSDEHFTFLGYRAYELMADQDEEVLRIVAGSGLGILRAQEDTDQSQAFASLPAALRAQARAPEPLVLTKANARSRVHRPVNLDYVGVKRFDTAGRVRGEHRFLGLYGSRAYSRLPQEIPLLRRKVARVSARADLAPDGHSGRALAHILETYPRDELIQIGEDELFEIATGIMQQSEEQRTRLFLRQDPYGRFISCLVYAPREGYDTEVRQRMQAILLKALNGTEVEFEVNLSESLLARILFTVRTRPGEIPVYDPREIEARLAEAVQSWTDHLHTALLDHLGEERGSILFDLYREAFPAGYREDLPARSAVRDIEHMERLVAHPEAGQALRMSLYAPLEATSGHLRFRVFRLGRAVPLSQALPMLENMGATVEDERPYRIDRRGSAPLWVHDFGLAFAGGETPAAAPAQEGRAVRELFQDAFAMVWQGRVEDDDFNRLVVKARLDWRQVALLRAYARYLRQTGITFSQAYMAQAVAANPPIAGMLVQLFEVRFDPARRQQAAPHSAQQASRLVAQLQEALDAVASLDQDRILRSFLNVMQATVRTNWYRSGADGMPPEHLAVKLRPGEIPDLPEPRPAFEIFVYSPRMEGVHLRGGKVARGGLRWSDRREDFRTEILGLMKAQMVKNAVIVPVGAKGGFVVKRPPADRDALRAEVLACYRQFIAGLLDLTDNLKEGHLVPPPDLIRYDTDDPYLVVAADKGTATFSDTANQVSADYGFWLADAFASGGATGYDHKKMGITARGAFECVKQLFLAAGVPYDREPFTVIGIGDMSGDVFGNGMLLSPNIRLIGAFDHRHIFIDPDPDPAASFEERRRLFALPASTWADYDTSVLSAGGGVYARSAKSIRLSERACAVLGTRFGVLTPSDLIRVLLRAPADLLWNGGIGTYVRARSERDADVGDRSNDAVRVTAASLRCRVVGEGGNLGLTQLARIEYARAGGRLDTDFVHNAGGVSCSDHEVNIKILLDQVVADGDLTLKQRNRLLEEMTEEVAHLVLQDCYWQHRAIGLDEYRSRELLGEHGRFIRALEQAGRLDRALEFLPDEEALAERQAVGEGLTRPEIALLISYAKHTLYEDLLAADVLEEACLIPELEHYFPTPLRERYRERIQGHRLRREILASTLANRLVNRMGSTFVFRLQEDLGVDAAAAVRAYQVAWEVFGLRRLWSAVAALDTQVPDGMQRGMLDSAVRLVGRASRRLLKDAAAPLSIAGGIDRYRLGIAELCARLPELVDPRHREALEAAAAPLAEAGVPADIALWVAGFDTLSRAFDVVEVAADRGVGVAEAGQVYFALGSFLALDWLAAQIGALPTHDRWLSGARTALRDELLEHHRALCVAALATGLAGASADSRLETFKRQQHQAMDEWLRLLAEIKQHEEPEVARLTVAVRAVAKLAAAARSR